MKNKTDLSLVSRAKRNDTKAFALLYKQVYEELFYYALANLGNADDAADCVQDTALDAFVGIKKLKDEGAFNGWIMKILITKIKQKQKEYIAYRQTQTELDDDLPCYSNAFEGIEIMDALSGLSDNERECIALKYISGYKGEEITKLTGIEHSTVRSHIARARQKLRAFLTDEEEQA
ncbi:MAG: sigma-70 family RNA polymerase sigma factor [Ruminococcus sp.]|nr:sigma-70 family RNA polymerase sigma factor [Ruminococcus sp.]